MMAALSLADRGLAERLITHTFHHIAPPTDSGADTPAASAPRGEDKAQIIGSVARDKVLGTIEACRDLLSRELPERREHWTNVRTSPSPPSPHLPSPPSNQMLTTPQTASRNKSPNHPPPQETHQMPRPRAVEPGRATARAARAGVQESRLGGRRSRRPGREEQQQQQQRRGRVWGRAAAGS